MADNIGTVVQGAHSGFYVYWAKHLGIDKEAFYLSERKNTASVSLSDICLDTSTVVGYEEIGSRTGPNFNAVAKSTLLGGAALGLLASSVSNIEEATFVVFLKNKESCTIHLNITWAVEYFRRIFVTKKGAGPNGSNMQQGGIARVSGDPKVLLERAFMFLEDGDWDKADIYCESVLDQNPKCAEAYLGKLMAEVEIRKKEDLSKAKEPLDRSDNYRKVMRFADESLRERLSNAKEVQHNEQLYAEAMACMTAASDEDACRNAAQKFYSLGSYKDSSSRREQCLQRADRIIADRMQCEETKRKEDIYSRAEKCMHKGTIESYNTAIQLYESVPNFRSSAAQISECRRKIEDLEAKEAARQVAVEKAKKKAKKIAIIAAPIVCACIAFVIVLTTVIIPKQEYSKKYSEAMEMIEAGNYDAGYAILEELGENETIQSNKYDRAIKLMDSGDYDSAYDLLSQVGKNDMIESSRYDRAIKSIDSGDYQAACALLAGLTYKDSAEKLQSIKPLLLAKANPGDTVFFGAYEQDNNTSNGKEDVEWLVLEVKDGKALVVSKYALDCKQYNTSNTNVTWETCTLRKWLNTDFINSAFSSDEKAKIPTVTVSADKNHGYSANPGNATQDQVFLLSITEANKYFNSTGARQCKPTDYAVANGAWESVDGNCGWWLRSPGVTQYSAHSAAYVHNSGGVYESGCDVDIGTSAVRPAMWISIK